MAAAEETIKQEIIKGAPYTPINFDQNSEADWLEKRSLGIGGSDAGTVAELNHYKTPYQLFMEKTKQLAPEDLSENQRVYFGNKLEDLIADVYAERTGRQVRRRRQIFKSKQHPFMLANIDRDIVGERRGLECKNVDKDVARFGDAWGKTGNTYEVREGGAVVCVTECDQVPESYLIQCQHYMAVMGYDVWDLAALVGGNEIRIYTIHRDEALIADLIALESEFWNRVETNTPPEISYEAPSTKKMLKRMYGPELISNESKVLPDEALHWHEVKKQALAVKKQYEATIECADNHLIALAGNAGKVYIPGLQGGYTRKKINVKGHYVEASEYVKFAYSANVK